jgi:hypothetical protein
MSQSEMILAHLAHKPITPLEALQEYGCFRLGARIWDLKRKGHAIEVEMVEVGEEGKRVAQYRLAA